LIAGLSARLGRGLAVEAILCSLTEVRIAVEGPQRHYNAKRPHALLRDKPCAAAVFNYRSAS
jgi:hypothetical protein